MFKQLAELSNLDIMQMYVQHSFCKYNMGLVVFLFVFSQSPLYYLFSSVFVAGRTLHFPHYK